MRDAYPILVWCVPMRREKLASWEIFGGRPNVALTRARKMLVVVGDSATLGSHPFYGEVLRLHQRDRTPTAVPLR